MDIEKKLILSNPNNREIWTTCENISNRGVEILPMLILNGILILEKWVQKITLREIFYYWLAQQVILIMSLPLNDFNILSSTVVKHKLESGNC